MVDELLCHNDVIQKFNNKLYSNILTTENLKSKQKAITLEGTKYYGYYLEKGQKTYFLPSELFDKMPLRVLRAKEVDFKGDVLEYITKIESIIIPSEKKMTFRQLVDTTPAFNHTNPLHFKLYKIVAFASYIDRLNARISTDAGFGKDSVVNIIHELVDSVLNIYGATFAKLEFGLINKLIILNELGNLKAEEKINMQEFLLATGAYFNTYNKRTRKTNTTQEQYDISRLSLLIFYNLPEYYIGKAQEYFDQIFTKAVIHRFIPFVFEGRITTHFEKIFNTQQMMERNEHIYKEIIASLNYYRKNNIGSIKYEVPKTIYFSDELTRYDRTFNVIMKYVSEYSESQEEFDILTKELYQCYKNYDKLLVKEKEML